MPLDEQCAVALDAVGAGLVERLSGGEVGGKLVLRKIAEGDARAGVQRVRPPSGVSTASPVSTSWVRPRRRRSMEAASSASFGLPRRSPSIS